MKLYHCSNARSVRPLWTLEELGVNYELTVMPFPPRFAYAGYLDINPIAFELVIPDYLKRFKKY